MRLTPPSTLLRLLDKGSGELLCSYEGHVHQNVKLDCCLTPSDAHVLGGSETGGSQQAVSCLRVACCRAVMNKPAKGAFCMLTTMLITNDASAAAAHPLLQQRLAEPHTVCACH